MNKILKWQVLSDISTTQISHNYLNAHNPQVFTNGIDLGNPWALRSVFILNIPTT